MLLPMGGPENAVGRRPTVDLPFLLVGAAA